MVKIYRGKIIPKSNSGIYPVYSSSIQNNGLMGFSNEYMFDDEKITWSIDGGGNFFFRKKHKYSVTNVSGIIDVTSDLINIVFLFYQLYKQQKKYKFDYQLKAHPSVIKKIYKIYLPDITIQNKIASLFLCLDELILLYEEKLVALETYNKGLRQKLFNQSIRFKRDDGTSYPEWKKKKLDDIGEIITGNTPSTQDSENYGNEFMFCSPADMGDNKYILKTGKMLSQKGFDISRKLPGGSVLVTCIGSTIGKIGIASKEMTSNQQINSIIAYDSINNEFIYYSLLKNFKKYLNLVSSQAVPILNKSQFEKLVISVPHIEEQQKIAEVLSCADELTEQVKNKILLLKITKTSLLNDIFD